MINLANQILRLDRVMKLGLCIAFSISVYSLSAQSRYLQIYSGISSTNISAKNFPFQDTKNRIGFVGGIGYEYIFESRVVIGVGVFYNQRGYVFEIPGSNQDLEATFDYDYISLPIKVGYTVGVKVKGFANFGILPSYLLKTVHTFPQFDNQTGIFTGGYQSIDRTGVTQRFDLGAMIEAGGS